MTAQIRTFPESPISGDGISRYTALVGATADGQLWQRAAEGKAEYGDPRHFHVAEAARSRASRRNGNGSPATDARGPAVRYRDGIYYPVCINRHASGIIRAGKRVK